MNNELVFYHNLKDAPYTTVSVIEKFTKNSRHSIMQLINRHKNKLEELGVLAFEMRKPLKGSKGGRPIKEIHLNEDQATFLITLLENTPTVVNFKFALVTAFRQAKQELINQQVLLERNHQTNKDLGEVIKEHFPDNPFMYSTFHNLAYKVAIGMNPKQVKQSRNVANAQDALTSDELDKVERYRTIIANLIELGMDYQQIKQKLTPVTQ
ncbi:Rha family transcriptional regulator [Weissella minor]|uniref:Rha family transcriptional regulator n=1 Tax=Weissella minor TaxID=1620 RepID=UPI001BAF6DAE|nr:Rha family transcriptional regulator [Weissella minor]MBS0950222.1 Rha family transcriptional regulator [Weissella minor]